MAQIDNFGRSVAIHDGTIVVGAPYSGGVGAGYIYTKEGTSWELRKKLVADDASSDDNFGWSVGVFEGTVIVGAPYFDENYYHVTNVGAAYVYQEIGDNDWVFLMPDDGSGNRVGTSVAIYGDNFVVGSSGVSVGKGAAFVYQRDTNHVWKKQQRLEALDGARYDGFGDSIGIYEDMVVVGAPNDDDDIGSIYLFSR